MNIGNVKPIGTNVAIQLQQYLLDAVYCIIEFVIIKRSIFIARLQVPVCNDQFYEFHFLDNFLSE